MGRAFAQLSSCMTRPVLSCACVHLALSADQHHLKMAPKAAEKAPAKAPAKKTTGMCLQGQAVAFAARSRSCTYACFVMSDGGTTAAHVGLHDVRLALQPQPHSFQYDISLSTLKASVPSAVPVLISTPSRHLLIVHPKFDLQTCASVISACRRQEEEEGFQGRDVQDLHLQGPQKAGPEGGEGASAARASQKQGGGGQTRSRILMPTSMNYCQPTMSIHTAGQERASTASTTAKKQGATTPRASTSRDL